MKGTISSSQKCGKDGCMNSFKYREMQSVMQCEAHPEMIWAGPCFVRFGRKHTKRFATVRDAERHLITLRGREDEGSLDLREYQKDQPLAFCNLVAKYLEHKEKETLSNSYIVHTKFVLGMAANDWGAQNIKTICEGEIEDFLLKDFGKEISNKTRASYKTVLSSFWKWVVRREKRKSKLEMPEFPEITFELGWRNIIDIASQQAIVEEVKRISYKQNPRIWLGIKLLTLYPKIRPGEMRNIQEGHINLREGWIVIPHPKEGRPKFVHLIPEHIELISETWGTRGLPHMFFFRHLSTKSGVNEGTQFGLKYFRVWWNKACENLGIKDVDLYGGTKHTTVTAAGKMLTPEQIKRGATGHVSRAFERYMLPDVNEARLVTQQIADTQREQSGKIYKLGKIVEGGS